MQHVLKVFDEKVVAALKLRGHHDTAGFIQMILNWWNTVNVSGKGQDQRLNDPYRAVQETHTATLDEFSAVFEAANSGQGKTRVRCLTHDTKRLWCKPWMA